MLQELHIENLALVESLELELEPGLTVLTGETGAGKSIIVDAVALLVGARASMEYIRAGAERGMVRGLFRAGDVPGLAEILAEFGVPMEADGSLLLSREITRSGRHSCRVNGRSLTLSMYQQIGQMLVDIHGQHTYQSILRPAAQMDLLDGAAGLMDLRRRVKELYTKWQGLLKDLNDLGGDEGARERQRDFLNYQYREIDAANLSPGEEEELLRKREILKNAVRLAEGAAAVYAALFGEDGAYDRISRAATILSNMAGIDDALKSWHSLLETAAVQVEEVARSILRYQEGLEYEPARLQEIEERLEVIKNLKRKYGGTIEAVLQYKEQVVAVLEDLDRLSGRMAALEKEIAAAEADYREAAITLRRRRLEASQDIADAMTKVLQEMAMPAARITIDCAEAGRPGPTGLDTITFLFQPNPGEGSRPLAQIASGGEMARVMLACKSILAEVDAIPTLIFDEIDAGIGGAAARAVAKTLAAISRRHQVLCVTHSAQLAGAATHHYRVSKVVRKGRTFTQIEKITGEARIEELARLLSGETTAIAKSHAAALLENIP